MREVCEVCEVGLTFDIRLSGLVAPQCGGESGSRTEQKSEEHDDHPHALGGGLVDVAGNGEEAGDDCGVAGDGEELNDHHGEGVVWPPGRKQ